jgi:hypothetical protein
MSGKLVGKADRAAVMTDVRIARGPLPVRRGLQEHAARALATALNDVRDPNAWWTYEAQEDDAGGWQVVSEIMSDPQVDAKLADVIPIPRGELL